MEFYSSPTEIRFDMVIESHPHYVKGMVWRSYMRKESEDRVILGLESSKNDGQFEKFGDTIFKRVNN